MTLLSRKTDYALLILCYLHQHADGGCARTIAESYGLSRGFVANILKELCQKGFVISQRGVNGGYFMQRSATKITLAELLEKLEDGFQLANCNSHTHAEGGDDECAILRVCPIRGPIALLHNRILETLRGLPIADLFGQNDAGTRFQPVLATLNLPLAAHSV